MLVVSSNFVLFRIIVKILENFHRTFGIHTAGEIPSLQIVAIKSSSLTNVIIFVKYENFSSERAAFATNGLVP